MSGTFFRRSFAAACMVAALVLCPAAARAQPAPGGGRVYREQLRVELDKQQAAARQIGLDGGGWFTFALFNYDDPAARQDRTLRQHEIRLWGSYTHAGVHTFYVRGVTGYDDWNSGDNPDIEGKSADDFREPRVERAWYQFDYDRLVSNRTGRKPDLGGQVKVGRDYYTIGTALTLALPLDAVQIVAHWRNWQVMGMFAMTIHDTANIDDSAAVSDRMDRHFYGGEVRYKGFSRHEPFAYFLIQRDHTGKDSSAARQTVQSYHYDSNYVGLGSTGSVLLPNLRYETELVFECGSSFAENVSDHTEGIRAMAFDVLLEYLFDCPRHPKVSFEYLFGSGDRNRRLSSTSTIGGNAAGTPDHAFNAFGFRDTGLAFGPDPANLHIFQGGVSVFPLEQCRRFRKMEVGTKVFFYMKHRNGGAISDTTAVNASSWVGWEWDLFCNWRITSDVSWTVRYGIFHPGEAFGGATDRRHFFYTGLTYSF